MKTIRILFFLSLLVITTAVFAQPFSIAFEETGLTQYAFDVPLDSVCGGTTSPIADGTIVKIYHDVDQDGPDDTDPSAPLCDDPPACALQEPFRTLNLNEFTFNGTELGIGTGFFMMQTLFTSIGDLPIPSKFYLRVCLPGRRYVSPVYTIAAGYAQTQECTWACEDSSCPGCEDPPPPTGLTASDSTLCTGVQLSWSHSNTAILDSFLIYRGGILIGATLNTVLNYLDTTAPAGQPLSYYVKARKNCGGGQYGYGTSATDNGSVYPPPTVIDSVSASDATCGLVAVTFRFTSTAGTDSIIIKRDGTNVAGWKLTGNPGFRTVNHVTTNGARARYTVVGYNSVCLEGISTVADSGTALQVPAVEPDSVRATLGLCNTTFVYWRNVAGATAHRVYRFNTSGGDSTYLGAATVSPYSDSNSPAGITYRYRVAAQNACGTGRLSTEFANGFRVRKVNQVRNVSASDSTNCDTVTVTWGDIAMEDSFKVIRQPVSGGTAETIARLAADVWVFYDLTASPGVRYNYRVLGKNVCGDGDTLSTANEGSRKAPPGRPGTPTASKGTACNGVVITWPDVAREDSFVVYRNGERLAKVNAGTLTYTDLTADSLGTRYGYSIMACNVCGCSTSVVDSGYRKQKPIQVTGVTATDDSCNNITIKWLNVVGEDGYRVLRNNALIATNTVNDTDYTDTPSPGTYAYRIVAFNACGTADTSAADSGRRLSPPPVVDSVWATDAVCAHVLVEWYDVAGEDSFQVRRNGTRLDVVAANVLSYTDISAVAGTRYKYTVAAYNACGAASPTKSDSGGRRAVPDSIRTMYATENNCDSILIAWMSLSNVDSYYVYRNDALLGSRPGILQFFVDRTATPGVRYKYQVKPWNSCGYGPSAAPDSGEIIQFPSTPTGVGATSDFCNKIRVVWTAATGDVDHYVLWRDSAADSFIVNKDSTGFDDSTSTFGTHIYQLRAVSDQCGATAWSTTAGGFRVQQAGIPGSVLATNLRCDSVIVTWTAATGDVDGYIIYADAAPLDTVGPDTLYFAHQPTIGQGYSYTVRALSNECGLSGVSNADTGARLAFPTSATGLTATTQYCDRVDLTWLAGTGSITGYIVRRDSVKLDTVDVLAFSDLTGTPGTTYYYDVITYSEYCGNSAPSVGTNGTRLPAPVSPDTVWATTDLCDSVIVTWNAGGGTFDGYKLYRNNELRAVLPVGVQRFAGAPQSGVLYRYTVSAYDTICGEADTTAWAIGTRLADATVPQNFSATGYCPSVFCDWDPSSGAVAGYILYRNDVALDTILPSFSDYSDTTAERGVTYEYTVSAYSLGCGETDISAPDSAMRLPLPVQVTMISGSFDVCGGIYIQWNPVVGTEWYLIYRDSVLMDSQLSGYTNFLDTNVVARAAHYYQVASKNICGVGAVSDTVSGVRKGVPDPVTGFFASDTSCTAIYLIWNDVPDDTGYVIYRDGSPLVNVGTGVVTYTDTQAPAGSHTYVVYAANGCGLSTTSEIANAYRIPGVDQVAGVAASSGFCDRVEITWADLPNEDGYVIWRDAVRIDTLDSNVTTYSHTPEPGTYAYQVMAFNECGEGLISTPDSGYRAWVPAQVTGVTATQDSCTSVTITWTDVATEGFYLIYRTDAFVDTVDSNQTSFVDTALAPGSYIYQVRAGNYCGLGLASTGVVGRVPDVPGVVGDLAASNTSCERINLSWTDLLDETYYRIFVDGVWVEDIPQNRNSYSRITSVGTHTFAIQGVNACGVGDTSAWVTGERQGPPTGTPIITMPDSTCGIVNISWTPVTDITGYAVYRDSGQVVSVDSSVTSWSGQDAVSGYHYYMVCAYNECGRGPFSIQDTIRVLPQVGAITGLAATTQSCSDVTISWNAVPNAYQYRVYRNGQLRTTTGAEILQYVDTPDTGTFWYRLEASNTCSTRVDSIQGRRRGVPATTTVTATDTSCVNIVVSWTPVADVLGYYVYQNDVVVDTVGPDTLTTTLIPPPGAYGYRVQPFNNCGLANASAVDSGHRLNNPGQVTGVVAQNDRCDSVYIMWDPRLTATQYVIYRDGAIIDTVFAPVTFCLDAPTMGPHWYRVRADNACGSGALSDSSSGSRIVAPTAPTSVIASDTLCGRITISWSGEAGDVDGFIVLRDELPIDTLTGSATADTITGTHNYKVIAFSNNLGCGRDTSTVESGNGHATAGVPGTPQFEEPVICDTVRITWTASTGEVEGYIVYRDGVAIDTVTTTLFNDLAVNDLRPHSYALRAYNSFCGNSGMTAAVQGRQLQLVSADPHIGDRFECWDTVHVPVTYCLPVDSIIFDLSVENGPYSFGLGMTYPTVTPDVISFEVPNIDSVDTLWNGCSVRLRAFRGTRIDTLYTDQFVIGCSLAVADEFTTEIPREFFLDQNYPNPFNPATTIRFGVPRASMVTIEVYDVLGRLAATLADSRLQPGIHNIIWDCSGCPSGMYIIRMKTDDRVFLRKMLLMK